ncbi:MAG: hypothetical protein KAG53_03220 [Endozoicomonadaceae bacterium]|nr:hypothetical protein [Endozoicomonadaceae bacterium]
MLRMKSWVLSICVALTTLSAHGEWRNYGTMSVLPDAIIAGNIVAPTLAMFVAQVQSGELSLVVTLPLKPSIQDTTELTFTLPNYSSYSTEFDVLRRTDTYIAMKTGDVDLIAILSGVYGEFDYVDVGSEVTGWHRFDLTGITSVLLELAVAGQR